MCVFLTLEGVRAECIRVYWGISGRSLFPRFVFCAQARQHCCVFINVCLTRVDMLTCILMCMCGHASMPILSFVFMFAPCVLRVYIELICQCTLCTFTSYIVFIGICQIHICMEARDHTENLKWHPITLGPLHFLTRWIFFFVFLTNSIQRGNKSKR